jgi:hypothetical protein
MTCFDLWVDRPDAGRSGKIIAGEALREKTLGCDKFRNLP